MRPPHLLRLSSILGVLMATACDDAPGRRASETAALSGTVRAVLVPHRGDAPLDHRIRSAQAAVRDDEDRGASLAQLGRLFVAKARRCFDAGYYSLAGLCGEAMEEIPGHAADAAFLRGVVAQAMHRFEAAEELARLAVAQRGGFEDHGLLGDVLLDRGALRAAGDAYQQMLDLKPCLQSYVRAGELEWRRGDVDGARTMFEMGRSAGSPRDAEALAWATCRLGQLELAMGRTEEAQILARDALTSLSSYAPAHLLQGRAHLSDGDAGAALPALRRAVDLDPLPESRWTLLECLEVLGHEEKAASVRKQLLQTAEREDPRTLAQFLLRPPAAGEPRSSKLVGKALNLARAEVEARRDALSLDALAWAQLASDDAESADATIEQALASGCTEPRVLLHAAVIARARGNRARAADLLDRCDPMAAALMPTERALLRAERAEL